MSCLAAVAWLREWCICVCVCVLSEQGGDKAVAMCAVVGSCGPSNSWCRPGDSCKVAWACCRGFGMPACFTADHVFGWLVLCDDCRLGFGRVLTSQAECMLV